MFFRRLILAFSLVVLCPLLLPTASGTPQQKKPAPPKKAPAAHVFKVQYRHPGWVTTRFTTLPAAHAKAAQLKRAGWNVKVKKMKTGAVVRANITRWKLNSVWANPALANRAAANVRAHGMQARIVKVH